MHVERNRSVEESDDDESVVVERNENAVCEVCRLTFPNELLLNAHMLFHTQNAEEYVDGVNHLVRNEVTAMTGMARDFRLWSDENVTNIRVWLNERHELVSSCFLPLMNVFLVRAMMYARVRLVQIDAETGLVVDRRVASFPSLSTEHVVDFSEWYERHVGRMMRNIEKYTSVEGSNWSIEGLDDVLIKISLSENVVGRGVFKLPANLKKRMAVVNVDCDHSCFKYAVLSMLHYNDVKDHRNRVTNYARWENELKFDGIDVEQVNIQHDVPKFEKMNDVKVNVHVWEKGLKGIRYNSRKNTSPRTVNLLLVVNAEGEQHYCGIPKLSRLYSHTLPTHKYQHVCERCTQYFYNDETYKTHFEFCIQGRAQIEVIPKNVE